MSAKADRIQKLLDSPELDEAFQSVREHYRDMIEETPLSSENDEALHDIRKMLHLLQEVRSDLETALAGEKLEDYRVAEQEKPGFLRELLHDRRH